MYLEEVELIGIDKLVEDHNRFYAHIGENDKKETLQEHSDLVVDYFKKIFNAKHLEQIFINFEEVYLYNISTDGKSLFRKMLLNVFSFHDLGKINPYFQRNKMKNNLVKENKEYQNVAVGSKHSIISSVLYLDYFARELDNVDKEEKSILRVILFINAYIISRHHSSLNEFNNYINMFDYGLGSDIIDLFNKDKNYKQEIYYTEEKIKKASQFVIKRINKGNKKENIFRYGYMKLVYSLLLASDFYATSEFMSGSKTNEFGDIDNIDEIYVEYKKTDLYIKIKEYEKTIYYNDKKEYKDINELRSEMFLDSEKELKDKKDNGIFFLEAPTGSGKSNVAFNLSFELIKSNNLKKILYIYPFNTLVEQNRESLNKIFENNKNVINDISVVNSITPIKIKDNEDEEELEFTNNTEQREYKYGQKSSIDYSRALLDRQFLNYPIVLTTHVNLFDIMFNRSKEDSFAFYQLANSVIVLDEIQSYKNIIWGEIISFLQEFSQLLNIKVIIMSATLPDLEMFVENKNVVRLIRDREKYFSNPFFKDRVKVNYDLLNSNDVEKDLFDMVVRKSKGKKVLVEFIKKKSAYDFYNKLQDYEGIECKVELITGDDNQVDRKKILDKINSKGTLERGIILVATQVVEAGVDIDMDIGFKDISKLDSEEQFMGRINRSCRKEGVVYFFDLDSAKGIYSNDVRTQKQLTLEDDEIRIELMNKDFNSYYNKVINIIKKEFNDSCSDVNLDKFFNEDVALLDNALISKRMKLIDDNRRKVTVFINRNIELESGEVIKGNLVWSRYCEILDDNNMEYAEKKVKLSEVISKVILFTYEIMSENEFIYNDRRGDIYYIEDGEQYFTNNKFNKDNLFKGDELI